jgi:hypothetical protein
MLPDDECKCLNLDCSVVLRQRLFLVFYFLPAEKVSSGLYTVSLTGKSGELSGTETKIGYIYVEPKIT